MSNRLNCLTRELEVLINDTEYETISNAPLFRRIGKWNMSTKW